ncbi:tetratricopeptide repeat protein [Leptothermofonsia sp. ETS-13]|uniref:tetratricopeptide repeat protein n=1 Tax=Leptothermofonsia sp. ETS-13 TaxID=3035696 RepID=UPI003BA134BF
MSRVALLIGVSRYPPGLNPLPRAQKDVEVMRRVLRQPQFGFEQVESRCDASLQEIEEAIETFFKNRAPDDQVLFLFCGYGIQDEDGRLYFATPETAPDYQGRLIKARTIPASFVQDVMDASPAKHQVVILDCYFRQGFGDTSNDDNPVDLPTQLGGDGRVLLTGSIFTHNLIEPADLDAWSYARYLVDGIETAAADTDSDGVVSAADLHDYARRKLAIAAPAIHPQLYGNEELAQRPLLKVPVHDPRVSYRKVLENLAEQGETDPTATTLLTGRSLLDDIKHSLGLSPQEAAEVESRSLQPLRDYRQRLQSYQERFSGTKLGYVGPNYQNNEDLKRYRQALGLTDSDTAGIEAAPQIVQQQQQREQHQRNLVKYEQVMLAVMQRQYPLTEGDRRLLHHLQKALQLSDEDVRMIESDLAARLHRREGGSVPPPDSSLTRPPVELAQQSSTSPPFPGTPPVSPGTPPSPPGRLPEELPLQPANVSYSHPDGMNPGNPPPFGPPAGPHPAEPPPVRPVDTPPSPTTTFQSVELPVNEPAQPPMKSSKESKAWPYGVLIITGVLLTMLLGTLLAVWSSGNFGNLFGSRPPAPPVDNQQAPLSPMKQAAEDINLGVTAHGIGDHEQAIKYYDQAIRLMTGSCQPGVNTQSSQCQLVARAYSNRSYAYFDLRNYNQALNDANSAVVLDPNLVEARINLANARFKRGDRTGALQDYERALQLRPSNALRAGIYNNRGNVRFAQNNAQAALQDYNQAINLKRNYADAYFNRGLAYEALNNIPNAINDFRRAAKFYQDKNQFQLADEAERKAANLQQRTPGGTASPAATGEPR